MQKKKKKCCEHLAKHLTSRNDLICDVTVKGEGQVTSVPVTSQKLLGESPCKVDAKQGPLHSIERS